MDRTSEPALQAIVTAAADALMIVDAHGVVRFANPATERMFNRNIAEIVNQPFGFPLTADETAELDIVRLDGARIVAELRLMPTTWQDEPAFVASLRDITERKEAEIHAQQLIRAQLARAQAEEAETRARFLAEASTALGQYMDHTIALNQLARVLVSYLAEWCIIDVCEPNARVERVAVAHADPDNARLAAELARLSPEAHPLPGEPEVLRSGHAILVDNWPHQAAAIANDFHRSIVQQMAVDIGLLIPMCSREKNLGVIVLLAKESKRAYGEYETRLAEEVARHAGVAIDNSFLFHEAQHSSEAKSNFLAVMSHELRTPLNAILGYSDLLRLGVPKGIPPEAQEHVERIRASARHLLQMIEEILAFSRMESDREPIETAAVSVASIARDAVAQVETLALDRGLSLAVQAPPTDYTIQTDARKLRHVLINLLTNAIKFTPRGSVVLRVSPVDTWTHFDVRDSGVGIEPEDLERIFDPFWQAEQGRTRQAEGTGLGLSVARRLAIMLGGNLVVQSQPGRGSTFTLQMPNAPPSLK